MPGYVRAAERREQLLAAARAVLIREGLDALTLRDVAAEAGVHLSTLQYIFSSRADLVDALAARVLADAGLGQHEVGGDGLAAELTGQVQWFASQFLGDEAMLELLRHEYVATISRVDPQAPIELPLDRHLIPEDYPARIAAIGQQAGETYQRPAQELGRLWGLGLTALFYEYLAHRDPARFSADAAVLVDAVVVLAQPGPGAPAA
jgi:AcrR family transcriptional regulator